MAESTDALPTLAETLAHLEQGILDERLVHRRLTPEELARILAEVTQLRAAQRAEPDAAAYRRPGLPRAPQPPPPGAPPS